MNPWVIVLGILGALGIAAAVEDDKIVIPEAQKKRTKKVKNK